jgi:asparagine synthase (glutamine-hydrolysing)
MCAICGVATASGPAPEPSLIEGMCEVMHHRGPDGRGTYYFPRRGGSGRARVAFGHNRLSIIDLAGGSQPLSNNDGTVWVAFNGEIYNFVELRQELEARGRKFRTNSDTEVIVHGYDEWGEDVVSRLNGMFAIALFDERTETLLLVRDRLGVKPLLYAQVGDRLVFASELKALLLDASVPAELDAEALVEYLTFNFTLAPRTLLRGVRRLPPGHLLRWRDGRISMREYWDLSLAPTGPRDIGTAAEMVEATLGAATKRRLRSDVPLGGLLSGGIDSSAVVSLMTDSLGQSVKAFSADFEESSYSEVPFARMVAERYGIDHRVVTVSPQIEDLLHRIVWYNDEPLGDSSCVPTFLLSEFVRKHVTVALSGDGGDETYFGYETYQADQLFNVYRRLPTAVRSTMIPGLVGRLPVSFEKMSLDFKLRQFVAAGLRDPFEAHCSWRRIFSEEERRAILAPEVEAQAAGFSPFETPRRWFDRHPEGDFLTRCLYVDLRTWLADDILAKVDRASMAHALEVRAPFLDYEAVELAFSLPRRLKLRGLSKKDIVKRAFAHRIPPAVLRRKKAGFSSPLGFWLRGPLRPMVHELLEGPRLKAMGIFEAPAVRAVVEDLMSGARDNSFKLWGLLNLVVWWETVVAGRARTPARYSVSAGVRG